MRKIMLIFAAVTLIAVAFMSTSVLAHEGMRDPMVTIQEDVGLFWVSKEVRNTQGEKLGTVKDFVRDSEGKVSFAIVAHGGFLGFGDDGSTGSSAASAAASVTARTDVDDFIAELMPCTRLM